MKICFSTFLAANNGADFLHPRPEAVRKSSELSQILFSETSRLDSCSKRAKRKLQNIMSHFSVLHFELVFYIKPLTDVHNSSTDLAAARNIQTFYVNSSQLAVRLKCCINMNIKLTGS